MPQEWSGFSQTETWAISIQMLQKDTLCTFHTGEEWRKEEVTSVRREIEDYWKLN